MLLHAPTSGQVQAGIEYLDKQVPNWYLEVDPDRLDMHMDWDCVLGQVFGSCHLYLLSRGRDWPWAVEHGFAVSKDIVMGRDRAWQNLTDEWKQVVRSRLEAFKQELATAL